MSVAGYCRCRYPTAAAAILLLYSRCRYSYLTLLPLLLLDSAAATYCAAATLAPACSRWIYPINPILRKVRFSSKICSVPKSTTLLAAFFSLDTPPALPLLPFSQPPPPSPPLPSPRPSPPRPPPRRLPPRRPPSSPPRRLDTLPLALFLAPLCCFRRSSLIS